MALTFDEALKAIDEKSDMEPYSGLFLIEIEDVKAIVMKLANTYAPTIKMTKTQYNYFKWLRDTNDSLFEAFLTVSYNENELSLFPELDLAQAWLHPERIKVID